MLAPPSRDAGVTSDTAFVSVIHARALEFLPDFFASLRTQTDRDFDLVLVNNGVAGLADLVAEHDIADAVPTRIVEASGVAAAVMKAALDHVLASGYRRLIFGDSDDWFANDRVAVSKALLEAHECVFNDLILFGAGIPEPSSMFGDRLAEGQRIDEAFIRHFNCLGMSNTALRAEKAIAAYRSIPESRLVFDWDFFGQVLARDTTAVYTARIQTHYRQHATNVASPHALADEQIMRGVRVKTEHYSTMSAVLPWYVGRQRDFTRLLEGLRSNDELRERYCSEVRRRARARAFWWEPILSLEEIRQ